MPACRAASWICSSPSLLPVECLLHLVETLEGTRLIPGVRSLVLGAALAGMNHGAELVDARLQISQPRFLRLDAVPPLHGGAMFGEAPLSIRLSCRAIVKSAARCRLRFLNRFRGPHLLGWLVPVGVHLGRRSDCLFSVAFLAVLAGDVGQRLLLSGKLAASLAIEEQKVSRTFAGMATFSQIVMRNCSLECLLMLTPLAAVCRDPNVTRAVNESTRRSGQTALSAPLSGP